MNWTTKDNVVKIKKMISTEADGVSVKIFQSKRLLRTVS